MLRDHNLFRWYGQTNAVLPLIALDGVRDTYPTRRVPNLPRPAGRAPTSTRPQLVTLASAIRASADPAAQAALVAAATSYIEGSRKFAGELEEVVQDRLKDVLDGPGLRVVERGELFHQERIVELVLAARDARNAPS